MLGLRASLVGQPRAHAGPAAPPHPHLRDLLRHDLAGSDIRIADHCCGCTAGQGSSCGGALESHLPDSPAAAPTRLVEGVR
jgi:hypothetical protein